MVDQHEDGEEEKEEKGGCEFQDWPREAYRAEDP